MRQDHLFISPPALGPAHWLRGLVAAGVTVLLASCGGGGSDAPVADAAPADAEVVSAVVVLTLDPPADDLPADAAEVVVAPSFHMAPVALSAPDDADARDNMASALRPPREQTVPAELADLPTRGLTLDTVQRTERAHAAAVARGEVLATRASVSPLAASTSVAIYTPAQIRAAYGLPGLPAAGVTPTAEQAAQLGAGQTIYIVNARHNANAFAELTAFNSKFGLPACRATPLATNASLPLAAASASAGCTFSVVYSTAAAGMTATAPAYDASWATEIALDVQWAHATAPLARIVLIEAADPSTSSLVGAIKLANAMGPGVVSMSFGATEGSWTASLDSAFTGAGMSYLAATGDAGAQVAWPAVSTKVLAVGGTTLTWTGSGARREVAWAKAGGGVSAYTATPSYQTTGVPGVGSLGKRGVADVAFNADSSTGQYVGVMAPGASSVSWVSVGGTSLATPQWAGLLASANAMRARAGKAVLGAPHSALYSQIAAVPGYYAAAFSDIVSGANGSCATCVAKAGYDAPSGLGSPNASALLASLSGSSVVPAAPQVSGSAISGKVGTALSFSVPVVTGNAYTCTLAGAPAGMVISGTCGVSWPNPVAGSYSVTVTARDNVTGLSGQGAFAVTVLTPAVAPMVVAATVNGKAGTALSAAVAVTGGTANSYTLVNAPAGLAISGSGVLTWASPVAGTYAVTVTAKNTSTGLSGTGVITLVVARVAPPVVTASALSGVAGVTLKGTMTFVDPNSGSLTVTISGAPSGMTFAGSGASLLITWLRPVTGSYTLSVSAKGSSGMVTQLSVPVTIRAK
jgi:subtilase family serine protease